MRSLQTENPRVAMEGYTRASREYQWNISYQSR